MKQINLDDDVYAIVKERAEAQDRSIKAQVNRDLTNAYDSLSVEEEVVNGAA